MTHTTGDFFEFFSRATGHAPYEYQRQLGRAADLPAVLDVPTGSGKTQAVLASWLYGRLVTRSAPRRLVYALPMRTLVEQTCDVAKDMVRRLRPQADDIEIHVLMGGEPPTDWRERPERDQILIGTIDMLISRALSRGYGESRFQWPVSFGLLSNDCRWVFDEVQLMGPARATSAQLDGLRATLGTAQPCESMWVSATVDRETLTTIDRPHLGRVLALSDVDRRGPLAARLTAPKTLARVDLGGVSGTGLPDAIATAVLAGHEPASRSIVVVNTVALAQAVARAIRQAQRARSEPAEVVLLHSRFRPPDRIARMQEALAPVEAGAGRIVVSTQVIEAGVDTSARLLATETAPFSSLVQRLGRCNRQGEAAEAQVLWLDRGDPDDRSAAPYHPEDLASARSALAILVGTSLSPEALGRLSVPERRIDTAILRRRDLIDLFDTSPDLSGMDVDVSRFIRDDDERNVSVFFRAIGVDRAAGTAPENQPAAQREEVVDVPIGDVRRRRAWRFDYLDGLWSPAAGSLTPGAVIMVDADEGGYDPEVGWDPRSTRPVEPVPAIAAERPEGLDDDRQSVGRRDWVTLPDHLATARDAAADLLARVAPRDLTSGSAEAVVEAAALHDLGKAHPAFQQMLLSTASDDAERARRSGVLWAKSANRGGRHVRRHFRHELASALAVRAGNGAVSNLTAYLVAAHHGRVRLSITPAPEEQPPRGHAARRFALGVVEGDELPAVTTPLGEWPATTLELACMELGAPGSWAAAACALRDDPALGPFRLAFLEALVRIADRRASG